MSSTWPIFGPSSKTFVELRHFDNCLAPDGYAASQRLARVLLEQGSAGIVYPSVREKGHGDCLSCFRPALVMNVRKGIPLSITFENALAMPVFERHS